MKKIKYSNLVIIGIFLYIIFQIVVFIIGKSTSTLVLEKENLEEKITTKGLFIREEYLIKIDASGKLNLQVDEGEKVKKDQIVACVYKDSNLIEKNNKEIEQLNSDIAKITNMKEGKAKEVASMQLETKKEQKKILENQNKKNTSNTNATEAGIISYKYDGKEEIYTLDMLNKLTKEDIINAENNYKLIHNEENVKEGQTIGRVINGYSTYIGICLSEKEVENLEVNQKVVVKINNERLDATIDRIYINNKENIVILKITNQNVEIYDTRAIEFDIIYKQLDGLKIPKDCIKKVDDKEGVYVVNQETHNAEFIELKGIKYENDDFVYIDYYQNDIDGVKTVKVYDEIILKPNNINKNIKVK